MIAKPAATPATCGRKNESAAAATVTTSSGQSRLMSVSAGRGSGSAVCIFASASSRAIGGEAAWWRPISAPITAAIAHQHTAISVLTCSPVRAPPMIVSAASSVAAPAHSSTVAFRKSTNRTRRPQPGTSDCRSSRTPSVPSTIASASRSSSGGPSSERTPMRIAVCTRPMSTSSSRPRNASRSVRSSPM